jgi:hypothetical protein
MSGERVILLEFNELTPQLIERFVGQGLLPGFERFQRESLVYTTDAEEHGEMLNPWIQWVTVHSGLSYAEHGVFHLGDGHKLDKKCIWDLLSDRGLRVWVCGSMNVRYDTPLNGCLLPDPWTPNAVPHPRSFDAYYKFVQRYVQEYTNDRVPLTPADYARFLTFMVTHGLSAGTVSAIAKQLLVERGGKYHWRRATLLDRLQYDVFQSCYRRVKPHFSTFFLNSTAHLQHAYWRNMDPEDFVIKPTPEEQTDFESAILYGYQAMDRLLQRFMELADHRTTVILSTALSQQPCLIYEEHGGKRFYRPRDFEKLLSFAGITVPHTCEPVMAEEFHVRCTNERDSARAEELLGALRVGDRPALRVHREQGGVFSGCAIHDQLPEDASLSSTMLGRSTPFFSLFYQPATVKSGMHHPDGVLWIRTPGRRHAVQQDKVSIRDIAPTVLGMFGIAAPAYMRGQALLDASQVAAPVSA